MVETFANLETDKFVPPSRPDDLILTGKKA